jgi:hypothetical protein
MKYINVVLTTHHVSLRMPGKNPFGYQYSITFDNIEGGSNRLTFFDKKEADKAFKLIKKGAQISITSGPIKASDLIEPNAFEAMINESKLLLDIVKKTDEIYKRLSIKQNKLMANAKKLSK